MQDSTNEQSQSSGVGEAGKRYGMTAGGQVREEELMAALQMLLERVEKGQFAMPGQAAHNQALRIPFSINSIKKEKRYFTPELKITIL